MSEAQLDKLVRYARKKLNTTMFRYVENRSHRFNGFQVCNAYLAARSIAEQKSLFITATHKGVIDSLIVPICLVLLDRILINDMATIDRNKLNEYMIFSDGRMKNIIYDAGTGEFTLCYKDKRGKHFTPIKNLSEFLAQNILINKKYYVDRAFSVDPYQDYIKLYQSSLDTKEYPPFGHAKKAIIVCPKNSAIEQISRYKLSKVFPYAFISASGSETQVSIKADPAIYFCPDYINAISFLMQADENVDFPYMVVLQEANVRNNIVNIRQDLDQGLFENLVVVCKSGLNQEDGALQWQWEAEDVTYLSGKHLANIVPHPLSENLKFDEACENVSDMVNNLTKKYDDNHVFKPILYLYLRMLRDKYSAAADLEEEIDTAINDARKLLIIEDNDETEVERDLSDLKKALLTLAGQIDVKDCYLESDFIEESTMIRLVVPRWTMEAWQQTIENKEKDNIELIPDNQFPKVLDLVQTEQDFWFSFVPPYNSLSSLLAHPLNARVNLNFAVSNAEIKILNSYIEKIMDTTKNRRYIPGWFPTQPATKSKRNPSYIDTSQLISQLMYRAYFEVDYVSMRFDGDSDVVQYRLTVRDEEGDEQVLRLAGTTGVIKIIQGNKQDCQVAELKPEDDFLKYSNPSSEALYKILSTESDEFMIIENHSKLWKDKLREYVGWIEEDVDWDFIMTERITYLSKLLDISAGHILNNWLSYGASVRFPKRGSLMKLLDIFETEGLVTGEQRRDIMVACMSFTSLMITLGHNLSAEIHRIIYDTKDETLHDYISREVFNREKNYPFLSKLSLKSISAIVNRNTPIYHLKTIEEEIPDENT
ncbi:MAG: hypothetical protein GXY81_00935 [Candidatus Cloacimonetes bacterium]|nr:hypothetical protein [Candidatus Cloacimonadota bacterium]